MSEAGSPFRRAIDALEIRTVDLAGLSLTLSEAFRNGEEPGDWEALQRQGHHGVLGARQMTGTLGSPPGREVQLVRYQFFADLAVRDAANGDEPGDAPEPWLAVRAEFDVEYFARELLDEAAIVAFGQRNVAYHVWPYWRELVQSHAARIRFPVPIGVPHYLVRRGQGADAPPPVPALPADPEPASVPDGGAASTTSG